jgi:hypothetical protein
VHLTPVRELVNLLIFAVFPVYYFHIYLSFKEFVLIRASFIVFPFQHEGEKIPNLKHQITGKSEIPMTKTKTELDGI